MPVLQPEFIEGTTGRQFLSCFLPEHTKPATWVLFLPPWAEEMNKSRRMMARLGHGLAVQGIGCCLPDHIGTGDSEGDFSDARWQIWRADLRAIADHLAQQGCRRLILGGLRFGALQAMELSRDLPGVIGCLLWQPVHTGQQQLTQFLRLRQAAGLLGGGKTEKLDELRARLAGGESLEIAGYLLNPELAGIVEQLDLASFPPPRGMPVHWFEMTAEPGGTISLASTRAINTWREQGADIFLHAVTGEQFWATQELVDVPELLDTTIEIASAL